MATPSYPPRNPNPLLPGPRASTSLLPPRYPPASRRWATHPAPPPPVGPSGYISPDPSPTDDHFGVQNPHPPPMLNRNYSFSKSDYFDRRSSIHPPPVNDYPDPGPPGPRGSYEERRDMIETDPFYYPVIPRSVGSMSQKRKANKKADGKQPTFLTKLYQILEQPEYAHIIRWDEAGEVIIIEKPDELADKILPLVYRQSRFASFSRQLNIYGFMRKVSLRHVDRGICDPDASTWSHPFLRRSSTPTEIQGFKRRVPPRPSQAVKRRASMTPSYHDDHNPGLGLSPTSSEGSYQSPPDAYHHHLLPDVEEDKPAFFAGPGGMGMMSHHDAPSQDEMSKMYPPFSLDRQTFPQTIAMPAASNIPLGSYDFGRHMNVPIPASAPAHIAAFPGLSNHGDGYSSLGMRISQGHIRTRSVQGEPPSATLFSPSSPLANPGWLPQALEQIKDDPTPPAQGSDNLERKADTGEGVSPTEQLDDPSAWMQGGYPEVNHLTPLERLGIAPSSVPNDFAPSYVSPGLSTAFLEGITPSTVSPGIYQHGFSLTSVRSTQGAAPRAVPTKAGTTSERGRVRHEPVFPPLQTFCVDRHGERHRAGQQGGESPWESKRPAEPNGAGAMVERCG